LPEELKRRRKVYTGKDEESVEYLKLHQFIEEHAKKNLEKHLVQITTLLQAAFSKAQFVELFAATFHGKKQLLLFSQGAYNEFI